MPIPREDWDRTPPSVQAIVIALWQENQALKQQVAALENQRRITCGKSKWVFLDLSGKPLNPDHVREVIWKPALSKAGIEYRPLMQTRHTFATISLSEGEDIGWVQNMLGHGSLQMIFTKYYAWIP